MLARARRSLSHFARTSPPPLAESALVPRPTMAGGLGICPLVALHLPAQLRVGRYSSHPSVTARMAFRSSRSPPRCTTRSSSASSDSFSRRRAFISTAIGAVLGEVAGLVVVLLGVVVGAGTSAAPPERVVVEQPRDDGGPPSQRHVARRHLGRHETDEVVLPDDAIDELQQRAPHPRRAFNLRVVGVEEDDEDARARVGGHLPALGHAVRARRAAPAPPAAARARARTRRSSA